MEPKVGIAVIVHHRGRILFGKRLKPIGCGTYELPGGSLEMFETFEHCAKREVFEETGLTIKNVKLVATLNSVWREQNGHFVTIVMGAEVASGTLEVKEPTKCGGWGWYAKPPTPLFETGDFFVSKEFRKFRRSFRWPVRVIEFLRKTCRIG